MLAWEKCQFLTEVFMVLEPDLSGLYLTCVPHTQSTDHVVFLTFVYIPCPLSGVLLG